MENPIKIDDLDWFGGTPIFGNTQIGISQLIILVKLARDLTRPILPKWWWKVREIPGYFREI